ncbi:uncharacterized protein VTP21DRAFT_10502 [Calcarisporiella thermophila]|uniref:uncharacterized protein n=1 Tax=Calcarisporiella thermophila TaxID=911321 RepID=UPI0037426844
MTLTLFPPLATAVVPAGLAARNDEPSGLPSPPGPANPSIQALARGAAQAHHPLHPDYNNLVRACNKISALADEVNEKVREAELHRRLEDLQERIANLPAPIAHPSRQLIAQADMFNVNPLTTQNQLEPRTYILLSDQLLICKPKEKGTYLLKQHIEIRPGVMARIAQERVVGHPDCFEIRVPDGESLVVKASGEGERREWIDRINEAIENLGDFVSDTGVPIPSSFAPSNPGSVGPKPSARPPLLAGKRDEDVVSLRSVETSTTATSNTTKSGSSSLSLRSLVKKRRLPSPFLSTGQNGVEAPLPSPLSIGGFSLG